MNKYVTGTAKVLKANADGTYELGFKCPDCESGWVTMQYKCAEKLTEGALIDVKIGKITKDNGLLIEQYLEEAPDADWMPALMILAKEINIIQEPPKKKDGRFKITQNLMPHLFTLKEVATENIFVGLSDKELTIDTLADQEDFVSVVPGHQMIDFTLIHHWWGNGEEFDHYDLFLGTDPQTHIVLGRNPLKDTEFKAAQRKPYTDDFWKRGEIVEQIQPNEPGNPSDTLPCLIERVDSGKVAVYENNEQPNGEWAARMEFFGTKLEGRWTFLSSIPYIWNVTRETTKLTEQFPMQLAMSGGIGGFKETPDGLLVEGKALSFGVWNGMFWSPEVIMQSPVNDFDNLLIDVEHKRDKVAGKVLEKSMTGADINVKFLVTDYETAEKIKSGEYKGLSIDAMVMGDPVRRVITQVKRYSRLTVCANPACRVCYIGNCAI